MLEVHQFFLSSDHWRNARKAFAFLWWVYLLQALLNADFRGYGGISVDMNNVLVLHRFSKYKIPHTTVPILSCFQSRSFSLKCGLRIPIYIFP